MLNISIKEFKNILENGNIDDQKEILNNQMDDKRKGIQDLIKSYTKKIDAYYLEKERIINLKKLENDLKREGYKYIGGIDEVGRGPLAGPVVSALVIFHEDTIIYGVNDSKKINEKTRKKLYNEIMEKALAVSIGICSNKEIDEHNIRQATLLSMKKAVENSKVKPDYLLIDGLDNIDIDILQKPIVKGDEKSFSIAAASIIAKVTRDEIMETYGIDYPEYNFKSNKGYGSAEHIEAIKNFGLTNLHRKTFTKNFFLN